MNRLCGNVIEQAIKVTSFRKVIREECRKKGLEYPSDDKIAEYIENGCTFNVNDFIEEYEGKIGIFKDPFIDFKNAVSNYGFVNTPTDDDMRSYVAENGYNVKGFVRHHRANSFDGIERDTLIATLKLKAPKLVKLWNIFVEESTIYGWFSRNDNSIKGRSDDDVIDTIVGYWDDIFPRIMLYPYAYQFKVEKYTEGDGSTYFDDIFFPILAEKLGYKIDGDKGTITKI